MEDVVEIMQSSFSFHNISVTVEGNRDHELTLSRNKLFQVYLTIMGNAKDVLVERRIKEKRIRVAFSEEDGYHVTTICDSAGGIPESTIQHLFEPYYSTKIDNHGMGLGLYIVYILVQKELHGLLEVNNSSEGACFTIKIPTS
jgi:C4-dicarboxylate-specific signal transduction histidine kinase